MLNAYVDTQLKNKYYGTEVVVTEDIKPEHLSNFWNDGPARGSNRPSVPYNAAGFTE